MAFQRRGSGSMPGFNDVARSADHEKNSGPGGLSYSSKPVYSADGKSGIGYGLNRQLASAPTTSHFGASASPNTAQNLLKQKATALALRRGSVTGRGLRSWVGKGAPDPGNTNTSGFPTGQRNPGGY